MNERDERDERNERNNTPPREAVQKNRLVRTVAVMIAAALVTAALLLFTGERTGQSSFFVMNTYFTQSVTARDPERVMERVEEELRRLEGIFSRTREDSEIFRLNAAAGQGAVSVSPETAALLIRGKELSEALPRWFDITIEPLVTLWNITGETPAVPEEARIEEARVLIGASGLSVDAAGTASLARAGQGVDLGGIAKGEALSRIAVICREEGVGGGVFSLGGNVLVWGEKEGRTPFLIGIRDPRSEDPSAIFCTLTASEGEILSTSGGYERWFEEDGVRYHHILDPETGYPVQSDLLSVTVIGKDGALCDALSTALFSAGFSELPALAHRFEAEVIAVREDSEVWVTPALRDRITLRDEGLSLRTFPLGEEEAS